MTVVAELTIPADEFALGETLTAVPDAIAEFERIVTHSQEWVMPFLWVRSDELDRFDRAIRRDATVTDVDLSESFDHTHLYRIEWATKVRNRVNVIFDRAGTLLEATGNDDQWEILVRFDTKGGLAELQNHFDRSDTSFTLRRILTQPTRGSEFELSPEQREALVAAVEMGYFEIPRQTDLAAVADVLGIAVPSASERLRRAITALTNHTLLVGDPAGDRESRSTEGGERA